MKLNGVFEGSFDNIVKFVKSSFKALKIELIFFIELFFKPILEIPNRHSCNRN